MNWERDIVRRTLEGAGDYPEVQLEFLLMRLESFPDALPAIADAISAMGSWYEKNAEGIKLEHASQQARAKLAEIVNLQK